MCERGKEEKERGRREEGRQVKNNGRGTTRVLELRERDFQLAHNAGTLTPARRSRPSNLVVYI